MLACQVNDELKMGKGKIGAQCAHAAVAVVERVAESQPHILDAWEENGQAKICLRADSTTTLVRIFLGDCMQRSEGPHECWQ